MERVRLRDPKNVDARAVLAAVYWSRGERDRAESEWQAACDSEQGLDACSRYKDLPWVKDVRRWPPALVDAMGRFLHRAAT